MFTICFDSSFTPYCNIKEDTLQRYTFCMQGNGVWVLLSALFSSKINSFKELFIKYHTRVSNSLDLKSSPGQNLVSLRSNLGPNCLYI